MDNLATTANPFPGGHPRRKQILAVLCLSLLMVVIDTTILNTALPTIARDLDASPSDLQWIVDAYTLVFAALLITAGSIGDRFGRRGALIAGLGIFIGGSVAAALATDITTLVASRALMGVGGAFVMPATLSIINTVFPADERAGAIGAWSAMSGIGIVLGPTFGGLLLEHFSWSSVFWANVPLAIVAMFAVATIIPSIPGQRTEGDRIDLPGALLSAGAMLAVIFSVIQAPDAGWLSAATLGGLAGGVAMIVGFAIWELRAAHPMIDVRIFTNRAFSAASASITIIFFSLLGALFSVTQYMQVVKGHSPLTAGVAALPFALAVLVLAPSSDALVSRFGARRIIPLGLSLMALGLFIGATITPSSTYPHLALTILIMGCGMGLTIAPASSLIMSTLPAEQAGAGSAVNDTVQEFGGSLGVAVIGSIVTAVYASNIDASGLPQQITEPARGSLQAAEVVAQHAGQFHDQVITTTNAAFTSAMNVGFLAAAGVALVGALVALKYVPSTAATHEDTAAKVATKELVAA